MNKELNMFNELAEFLPDDDLDKLLQTPFGKKVLDKMAQNKVFKGDTDLMSTFIHKHLEFELVFTKALLACYMKLYKTNLN
tara:strand:- start:378 stop:620 length:243 start_codon:yes stop_codon:yes gene_type:complete